MAYIASEGVFMSNLSLKHIERRKMPFKAIYDDFPIFSHLQTAGKAWNFMYFCKHENIEGVDNIKPA